MWDVCHQTMRYSGKTMKQHLKYHHTTEHKEVMLRRSEGVEKTYRPSARVRQASLTLL